MAYDPNQPRDERGRWTSKTAGGVVAAALLAGLMTAAGGGDVTSSVGAALDAASSQSSVEAETSSSRKAAASGDEAEAWQRLALKQIKQKIEDDLQCAVQSYGQVQQFFLRNPCDKLDQLLFVVADRQGDPIVGSVAWIQFSSDSAATRFLEVEDTYGSGDLTPFATEALGLAGFHFTGKHYKSRQDGSLVVIAEADPLRGPASNDLLLEVATVADVLPPSVAR
jgi:hypothetical protein